MSYSKHCKQIRGETIRKQIELMGDTFYQDRFNVTLKEAQLALKLKAADNLKETNTAAKLIKKVTGEKTPYQIENERLASLTPAELIAEWNSKI